ncbi:MAG TPA: hypothetical protein VK753_05795 [Xanthomonadaceae bacterium]|jgi:hypothetical protein|nr:hypothetical protein [Xanthomonadaceae bacterium]
MPLESLAIPNAHTLSRVFAADRFSMTTAWAKSRALAYAISGHAVLLGLLCMGWMRSEFLPTGGVHDGSSIPAVEATLVAASSQPDTTTSATQQAEPPPVAKPTAVVSEQAPQSLQPEPALAAPTPPLPATDAADPVDAKPIADPVVPSAPPRFDDVHEPVAIAPPSSSQHGAPDSSADASPPASEPGDPYAQMRRERAEAERRYQLEQQGAQQQSDRRVPDDPANAQPTFFAPAAMTPYSPASQFWPADLQSPLMQIEVGGDWRAGNGLPSNGCLLGGFQSRNMDGLAEDWFACFVGGATARDFANGW